MSAAVIEAPNAYDEVPYESYPFPQSHPDRLATIATLYGMTPAPIEKCRVLELGCSSGGNLIPLAELFPDSQFVGIDFSRVELDHAEKTVQALGLSNLQLLHRNIRDLTIESTSAVHGSADDLGKFDYIISHGVYSWIPTSIFTLSPPRPTGPKADATGNVVRSGVRYRRE